MAKLFILSLTLTIAIGNVQLVKAQIAERYEIDTKRIGVYGSDKDALPRSREFIRLDSTYYVGYQYEGIFKYSRAADYLGYKNCIIPLRRSFLLFDKDYKNDYYSTRKQALRP